LHYNFFKQFSKASDMKNINKTRAKTISCLAAFCTHAGVERYRLPTQEALIIIIIMNFYSPVSNNKCHSIGHKMRTERIKIRVDSQGRWERA
jgi:hypothetical protein